MELYNHVRLHSALKYITPHDKLLGREQAIFAERDRKLEAARARRQEKRQQRRAACYNPHTQAEDKALLASTLSADLGPEASEGAKPMREAPSTATLLLLA